MLHILYYTTFKVVISMDNNMDSILKNSDPATLLAKLSPEERKLLDSLIKDKSARAKFLSSAEAQKIIKMMGGK
jgi:hypothetical protein